MPEVSQSMHGSGEQSSTSAKAGEAPWLGDLKLYGPNGEIWGWAQRWKHKSLPEGDLVVIPRLYLAQTPMYRLVHMRSYPDTFSGCRFCAPGLVFTAFQIYGAFFPFYKTGRPELHQGVTALEGSTTHLPEIIRFATKLLT